MSVYGFNVNPPDAWENYRSNPNRFMLDGMYAEEWKNAEKGRTFNQFWDKQKKVLLENSSNIFTDNLNIEKFSLDTLLNASMSTNTSDVKQILKSYSSWQHLDDIASGKANGNIFGFDLETFGDVYNKQGMFGITELGLSELKYKDNLFKIDKSVSLAIGITNEEAEYFHNLIGKVKKDGWSSLEQNEQVTLLRLSMYSGNFFDRFKNISGKDTVLNNNKTYVSVKNLAEQTIKIDAFESGISNLLKLSTNNLNNGVRVSKNDVIGDFLDFVVLQQSKQASSLNSNNPFYSLFYGANSKFDINSLSRVISGTKRDTEQQKSIIKNIEDNMLDVVYMLRASAAKTKQSVGSFMEENYGVYTGASVENQTLTTNIGGKQIHHAGSDTFNEGLLLDFQRKELFQKYFKDINSFDDLLKGVKTEDALLFIKKGQLDKRFGNEYAYINNQPISNVTISNEYWTIDPDKTGVITNDDGTKRFVTTLSNFTNELNELSESVNVVISDTDEKRFFDRMQELINNSYIQSINELTEQDVNLIYNQQKFKHKDQARKTFASLFSVNEIKNNNGELTAGFDSLKKMVMLHDKVSKWEIDNYALDTINEETINIFQRIVEDLNKNGANIPIKSRYQSQSFLEMRKQLSAEKPIIDDIIKYVDNHSTNSNIDKTILANKLYKSVFDTFSEKGYTQFINKNNVMSTVDYYGVDLVYKNNPYRIGFTDVDSASKNISRVFNKISSINGITEIVSNLKDRGIINNTQFNALTDKIDNITYMSEKAQSTYLYSLSQDVAYNIQEYINNNHDKENLRVRNLFDDISSGIEKQFISPSNEILSVSDLYSDFRNDIISKFDNIQSSINKTEYLFKSDKYKSYTDSMDYMADDLLKFLNMDYGDIKSKKDLIIGMFEAKDFETQEYKKYAINGRANDNVQALIITPEHINQSIKEANGGVIQPHEGANAYLFLSKNNDIGKLMELINSREYDDTFKSFYDLKNSELSNYGAIFEIPRLNKYYLDKDHNEFFTTIRQSANLEKFLVPQMTVREDSDGTLKAFFNDAEFDILSTYRQVGESMLNSVSKGDYKEATRIGRRALNERLKNAPSSSTYSGSPRIMHFTPADTIHAYELRVYDALETIFKKGVLGTKNVTDIDINKLNPLQRIVNAFGDAIDVKPYNDNYYQYFESIMNKNEFKEFLRRRMLTGSPADETWINSSLLSEDIFNKPILEIIKDYINNGSDDDLFHKGISKTSDAINSIPNASDLTAIGSESAVAQGSYFTKVHGSNKPFAGLYSMMRPVYVQQFNVTTFDPEQLKKEINEVVPSLINRKIRTNKRGRGAYQSFSSISVGSNLIETNDFNEQQALKNLNNTFTGERDFILRTKLMNMSELDIRYSNLLKDDIQKSILKDINNINSSEINLEQLNAGINVFQRELNSLYQDKVFISPALKRTTLFSQRDPIKLSLNLNNIDIEETEKILNNIIGDNDYGIVDSNTVIAKRKDGTSIFFNKATSKITSKNINELLDEDIGETRLDTEIGDILDDKMMFNGMEKATVHSVNIKNVAEEMSKYGIADEKTAFNLSTYLFNYISDGAMAIGSFKFGKHGGVPAIESIFNTITKNYIEAGYGKLLANYLNSVSNKYNGIGNFEFKNLASATSKRKSKKYGRLIGNTAFGENSADFVLEVLSGIKASADGEPNSIIMPKIDKKILEELRDLEITDSLNMTAHRQNMNEHMGTKLVIDHRIEQGIRMRGLNSSSVSSGEELIGLSKNSAEWAKVLKDESKKYNAKSINLNSYNLKTLQKFINKWSTSKNRDRIQYSKFQNEMSKSLKGVIESINYYENQFSDTPISYNDIANKKIVEVDILDMISSTSKSNMHRFKNGSSIEEAKGGLFFINGEPSSYLKELSSRKGFDINGEDSYSIFLNMKGYNPIIKNSQGITKVIDGFMLPILSVNEVSSFDDKLFFQNQQKIISKFINNVVKTIESGKEDLDTSLGVLYTNVINELNAQTKLLDKDSDMYKLTQQYVVPNSQELLALDESAPMLDNEDTKKLYSLVKEKKEYEKLFNNNSSVTYDENFIKEYYKISNQIKDLSDKIANDYKNGNFSELSSLKYNKKLSDAATSIIDGKKYHGLVVGLSEEAIERMGYDFGSVAIDIVADYQYNLKKHRNTNMNQLKEFVSNYENGFDIKITNIRKSLEKEFESEGLKFTNNENMLQELDKFLLNTYGTKEIIQRKGKDVEKLNITIKDINESISERVLKTFRKSGIGQDYFSSIGTYSEYVRFPSFNSQPIVKIILDKTLKGEGFMARITNPILSLISNVDFDGDKIFLASLSDGSSVIKKNTKAFKLAENEYNRFIKNEGVELLSEALKSMDAFNADDPNALIYQQSKLLEIVDNNAYKQGLSNYLKHMKKTDIFREKTIDDLLNDNALLDVALRSQEMDKMFKKTIPNTLLNEDMQVSAYVSRFRKAYIGHVSTPNYKVRVALNQALNDDTLTKEQKTLISDTLFNFSNLFNKDTGLFSVIEQKAIDPKHAKDSLNLSRISQYSTSMYSLIGKSYNSKTGKINEKAISNYMFKVTQSIAPQIYQLKNQDEIEWLSKVISASKIKDQQTSSYLLDLINKLSSGENISLYGKALTKDDAKLLKMALPMSQLLDVIRTVPQFTDIFNKYIYNDDYRTIKSTLDNLSNDEIQDLINKSDGAPLSKEQISLFTSKGSKIYTKLNTGDIYVVPSTLIEQENELDRLTYMVYNGMDKGKYKFSVIKSSGELSEELNSVSIAKKNIFQKMIKSFKEDDLPKFDMSLPHYKFSDIKNNEVIKKQFLNDVLISSINRTLNDLILDDKNNIRTELPELSKITAVKGNTLYDKIQTMFSIENGQSDDVYKKIKQYVNAYELAVSDGFLKNKFDSTGDLIRSINESISQNKGNKDISSTWEVYAKDFFSDMFGSRSSFENYISKSINVPSNLDIGVYNKVIDNLNNSVYDINKELSEIDKSFIDLNEDLDKLKTETNKANIIDPVQQRVDSKKDIVDTYKSTVQNHNIDIATNAQNKIYKMFDKTSDVDYLFKLNLSDKNIQNMTVGFGTYMGKRFGSLNEKDIEYILNEADIISKSQKLNEIEQYGISKTIEKLNKYKPTSKISAISDSKISKEALNIIDTNATIGEKSFINLDLQKKADKAFKQVEENINKEQIKKKTLTSSIFETIKEKGITGKHVGYGIGALAALGLVNNLLHKDRNKSPLETNSSLSNNDSPTYNSPSGASIAPPTRGKQNIVYHGGANNGINFRVSASTKQQLDYMDSIKQMNATTNGLSNILVYNDTSGISDNWLSEKFAELAQ